MPNIDINDQLLLMVGRIEGKLDALGVWAIQHGNEDKESDTALAIRLSSLEKWKAYLIGIAAAGGAVAGTGATSLAKVLGFVS